MIFPTGIKAHAVYHFNRNAIATACLAGDGLIALTDTGNIQRYDLHDLRLQHEVRPDVAYSLLIKADCVGVVAASVDGRVFCIEPKTLQQIEIAKLNAVPIWMTGFRDATSHKHGILAVVRTDSEDHTGELEIQRIGFGLPTVEKYKVAAPRSRSSHISSFFLDRKNRLWLGKDDGEWGGWCASLDLNAGRSGKIVYVEGFSQGVYGFVELPDGQIWAYGGMMHFSSNGFIARIDRGTNERLGLYAGAAVARPKQPLFPITHVIPDPNGDGLLVFAYRDLFRVNTQLKNWQHLASIDLRYRWGRPDAMGSYPALRTVLDVGDKSGDLICTTGQDGLRRIKNGSVSQYMVPGQIGDDRIGTIFPAAGTSLLRGEDLWRYSQGSWETISLYPRTQPDEGMSWYEQTVMLDPERRPMALSHSNRFPGTVALTKLKNGKVDILASQSTDAVDVRVRGGFATPDGSYWCVVQDKLLRLVDGKWRQVGTAPDRYIWNLQVVGRSTSSWILHDESELYRLTPGKAMNDSSFTQITIPKELGKIRDALSHKSGQILLACTAGLRLIDVNSGIVSPCPFAPPKGEVLALCEDGLGRTWLAGSSVWLVDANGMVHDFDRLVRFGVVAHAIGADSTNPAGVFVALRGRGVLSLRTEDAGH